MTTGPTWPIEDLLRQIKEAYTKERIEASWSAEANAVKSAMTSISARLPTQRYTPKSVLGVGGSGIVLRLRDSLFPTVDNALKFPRPVNGKVELVAEMLSKEMSFLTELRHPGIVKILFYTKIKDVRGYGTLPFYLMEAVDGTGSKRFVLDLNTDEQQFISLIRDTSEIIHYFHSHKGTPFAHLDIKPENIIADRNGRPTLIDLGTCKRLGADDHKTLIACTRSYAHPELVRHLAKDPSDSNRARGDLSRSKISPRWDLWSFGLTMLSWLGLDAHDGSSQAGAMLERLAPYTRKYLLLLCARLLTDALPTWLSKRVGLHPSFIESFPITTSEELLDLLRRVDDIQGPIESIPELASATTGSIQAAPGTHVVNTERLRATLAHRLVRRLNTITQLGLVSQIYPSARHSRREHSLGTYANAGRMVKALYYDPVSPLFRQIISARDICDLLLSALLHDIGQFPLAHDLEEIDKKVFDHDQLTQAMLKGSWTKKKKGSKDLVFEPLHDIFAAWNTNVERIVGILNARPTSTTASAKEKLLRSIISGPIDADKLDYLFRDARHTDVPYPNGVDVDRLFRCVTTIVIERVDGGARDVPAIGVHAKGKVAADFLTFARYAMFSQVYWHHAVRAQKAMLLRGVEALLSRHSSDAKLMEFTSRFVAMVCNLPESLYHSTDGDPSLFPDETKRNTGVSERLGRGTDLAATDAAVLSWLYDRLVEVGQPEATLIDDIMTRSWFKRLWVVTRDMQVKRWDKISKLWDQLDRSKRHQSAINFERAIAKRLKEQTVGITSMPAETARALIEQMTTAQQPWLLIDIPGPRPGSETGLHYVLESQGRRLRKDDRTVGDLQQSEVWEDYAQKLSQAAGKVRIFAHPKLVDTIDASLEWELGIDDLASILELLQP